VNSVSRIYRKPRLARGLFRSLLASSEGVENIARQSGSMESPPAQRFTIPPFDTRAPQAIRSSAIIAARHQAPAIPQGEYFRAISLGFCHEEIQRMPMLTHRG